VAEGVETEDQLNFLKLHHCDEIQGHYFSSARPVDECTRMLMDDRRMPESPTKAAKDGTTLLLVADNDGELTRLKRAFTPAGYRVLTAKNTSEGFEILARHHPQIVVSDSDLPGRSGVDFLTRVRQLYPHTLRVLTSSGDAPTLTRATNNAGIHLFMPKSWTAERLCAEMRDTLKAHAKKS
jgi:response regulator RpfG family c-di-GMP phosphodiesterase